LPPQDFELGSAYQNNDLVFASEIGTPRNSRNPAQSPRADVNRAGHAARSFSLSSASPGKSIQS
jgi:hypothetical protein